VNHVKELSEGFSPSSCGQVERFLPRSPVGR
jgi:hypothetical protein